jgi:hypothetical protein
MAYPAILGPFHLMWIGILIAAAVLTALFLRRANEKANRWVLISFALICIIFEIGKQLRLTYAYDWQYKWHIFPFQFCSAPMYICLIAAFLPDGKVRQALYNFLAVFGMFGGLAVCLYPEGVFTAFVFVNCQTMIHHVTLFLMGFYLIMCGRIKLNKGLVNATTVFLALIIIAQCLNIAAYLAGISPGQLFNMFFISPFHTTTLPVLPLIQEYSFALFHLTYFTVVTAAAYATFFLFYGGKKLCEKLWESRYISNEC